MAKKRKLKGNAEAIAGFPPQPDLIDVVRLNWEGPFIGADPNCRREPLGLAIA
ncbi:hypothetical protein [Ensifer sp. SSB1]|uniref:hypothetical protein n=1 Tax=Ensifer sp. SSB1 TaxID=2795385 RepID=UPI001A52F2D7|nr:hypothetical protein [Ensifer sp. SSB1]MBK5569972.1 hypothetical protein [Ensifer sp. SSB1]